MCAGRETTPPGSRLAHPSPIRASVMVSSLLTGGPVGGGGGVGGRREARQSAHAFCAARPHVATPPSSVKRHVRRNPTPRDLRLMIAPPTVTEPKNV